MRPGDSAWAEPLGTFALIALAWLLGIGWHAVQHRRRVRRERQRRAAQRACAAVVDIASRLPGHCPMQCGDPACPYEQVHAADVAEAQRRHAGGGS